MISIAYIISILLFIHHITPLNVSITEDKLKIIQCVSKIYKYVKFHRLILQTFDTDYIKHLMDQIGPLVYIESSNLKNVTSNLYKFYYNVMIVNDFYDFKRNIDMFYRTFSWNARAKFIIIFEHETNISKIFEYAWKIYVLNIIIVHVDMNIYTYFPYEGNKCGNFIPVKISSCKTNQITNFFPEKVPKNLHGCRIKTLPLFFPPYIIQPNHTNPLKRGIEILMLDAIAKVSNFEIIYIKHNHSHFGFKYGKTQYSHLFEKMYNYEGDMVFGTLKLNTTLGEEFESITPHLSDAVAWYAPIALEISFWKNLIIVFHFKVWFAIIFMLLLCTFTWWITGTIVHENFYNNCLWCGVIACHTLLLGSVRQPKKFVVKLIFITWIFAALLLSTIYISKFTSILTNPVYDKQISNEKEMIESGIEYGFDQMAKGQFNLPDDKIKWTIYKNFVTCSFERVYECINRTLNNRDFIAAKNKKHMIYSLRNFFNVTDGTPRVYEFKEEAYKYFLNLLVNQGFPLKERIEEIVLRIQAAGLFKKWIEDFARPFTYFKIDVHVKQITLEHLAAAFWILLFGFILSFTVFLLEIVTKRFTRHANHIN